LKRLTVLALATSALLASCGGGDSSSSTPTTPPVNCFGGVKGTAPFPQVTMVTSKGSVVVELYPTNAPNTVANFLQYVTDGFYKDKIFHRVISNFVIQGGGFNAALLEAPTRPAIKLEVCNGLSNTRGTIAMARTAVLDSATAQFFVNVVDNPSLDTNGGGYAVFGKVVKGMDVVDAIKAVPTQAVVGFGSDVPVTPVVISAITKTQ
jgi:peptidyl-prolyl cis-trans isomerase A (cyclophilin A)